MNRKSLITKNNSPDLKSVEAGLEKIRIDYKSKIAMKALTSGKSIAPAQKKTYVKDVMKAVDTGLIKKSDAKVRAALRGATK